MENTLIVKNMDGVDIQINVIDIIEDSMTNKEYICYNIEGMDNVFISRLVQDDESYTLESITEEEKNLIQEVMMQDIGE